MLKIKHVYFLRPFFENWRIFSFKNIELANEHRKNAHLQQPHLDLVIFNFYRSKIIKIC